MSQPASTAATRPAPSAEKKSLRRLAPDKIVDTARVLSRRIEERFPGSGLASIAGELHTIAQDAVVRAESIRQPDWRLRGVIGVLIVLIAVALAEVAMSLEFDENMLKLGQFLQLLDSSSATLVFIGAVIFFLISLEVRLKRERALKAVRELRSLAHIVDMHQLTKDPERVTGKGPSTDSSPKRQMTPFELSRYLDYCSELLSLISKIGALYVQDFPDTVALEAVDQLATLTNALTRNIWQKIIIVQNNLGPETPKVNHG